MPTAHAHWKDSAPRYVTAVAIALFWAVFVLGWARVISTQAGSEVIEGLLTVGAMALSLGLGLALWIRHCLHLAPKPALHLLRRSIFDHDHFGRPICVLAPATLGAKHMVVLIQDGRKIYQVPELPAVEGELEEEEVLAS